MVIILNRLFAVIRNILVDKLKIRSEDWFLAAIFTYCLGQGLSSTTLTMICPEIMAAIKICMQLFALTIVFFRLLTKPNMIPGGKPFLLLATPVIAISAYVSRDNSLVWLALFASVAYGVRLQAVAGAILKSTITVLMIAFILVDLNQIPNLAFERAGVIRYAMGFLQPNNLGLRLFELSLSLFIFRGCKFRHPDWVALLLCLLFNEVVCDSRTSSLMIIMVGAIATLCNCAKPAPLRRVLPFICIASVVACVGVSAYFMVFYEPTTAFHQLMNQMLSDRLYLAHYYYMEFPPRLLGQDLGAVYTEMASYSFEGLLLDNAYLKLLMVGGILIFAIAMVTLTILILKSINREGYICMLAAFTIMAFHGITETAASDVAYNFALLSFAAFFYGGSGDHIGLGCGCRERRMDE